jgi:hypothetical protein
MSLEVSVCLSNVYIYIKLLVFVCLFWLIIGGGFCLCPKICYPFLGDWMTSFKILVVVFYLLLCSVYSFVCLLSFFHTVWDNNKKTTTNTKQMLLSLLWRLAAAISCFPALCKKKKNRAWLGTFFVLFSLSQCFPFLS